MDVPGPRMDEAAARRWERAEDHASAVQQILNLAGAGGERRIYADDLEPEVIEDSDERGPIYFSAVTSLNLRIHKLDDCYGNAVEMAGDIAAELRRYADRIDEQCRAQAHRKAGP